MVDKILATIGGVTAGAVAVGLVLPVFAANPLSGSEIGARFSGASIKATSIPGGSAYQLTLSPDGQASMKPIGGDGATRAGTWRVAGSAYCSQWDSASERCFTIVPNGRAYDVVDSGGKVVARWTT